jgi:hypothetical protein
MANTTTVINPALRERAIIVSVTFDLVDDWANIAAYYEAYSAMLKAWSTAAMSA